MVLFSMEFGEGVCFFGALCQCFRCISSCVFVLIMKCRYGQTDERRIERYGGAIGLREETISISMMDA